MTPGAEQASAPPLNRQQMVASSVELIENVVTLAPLVELAAGPAVIAMVGRMVSMDHIRDTVGPSPIASRAKTVKVLAPSGSAVAAGPKVTTPAPEQRWAAALNCRQMVEASDAVTVKVASAEPIVEPSAGPAPMTTVGRTVSIVQRRVTVGPKPIASDERAVKTMTPSGTAASAASKVRAGAAEQVSAPAPTFQQMVADSDAVMVSMALAAADGRALDRADGDDGGGADGVDGPGPGRGDRGAVGERRGPRRRGCGRRRWR